jgi:hypothetical protein
VKTLILIIFIFLVTASNGPAPSPLESTKEKESHTSSIDKPTTKKDESSQGLMTLTMPKRTSPTSNSNEEKSGKQRDKPSSENKLIIFFTGALATFSFFQLLTLIQQYYAIRNERRVSERAWIMPSFSQEFIPGDEFIAYVISNTGKTPAFVKYIQIIIGEEYKGIDIKKRVLSKKEKLITQMVVFPDEKISMQDLAQDSAFIFCQQKIIIWGVIIYDDVFGDRHSTRFCRAYNKENKLFVIGPDAKEGQNDAT